MRRGLSLLEIVVATALLLVAAGLFLLNTRPATSKAGARSLAQLVAEELRRARQLAISQGQPVAVCFPSDEDRFSHCHSLYVLRGWDQPRIERRRDFSQEFKGVALFNGRWPSTPPMTVAAPATEKFPGFDVAVWLGGSASDFCYVFLPDGSVTSNGLPSFDQAFHLVSAHGLRYAGATGSSPIVRQLEGTGEAYTVSVSFSGAVEMNTGVTGSALTATVELNGEPGAALIDEDGPFTGNVTIREVTVLSASRVETLPSGVSATLGPNEYLELGVLASADQGGELYCEWTSRGGGTFSYPGRTRMRWDAEAGGWRSDWVWRPSLDSADGQVFELTCEVEEATSGVTVQTRDADFPNGSNQVQVVRQGQVLFEKDLAGRRQIFLRNLDGNYEQHLITSQANDRQPQASADGSRIAFRSDRAGTYDIYGTSFEAAGLAGDTQRPQAERVGRLVRISNSPGIETVPTISPAGDRVAWKWVDAVGGLNLCLRRWDGGPPSGNYVVTALGRPSVLEDRLCWTADGRNLLFDGRPPGSTDAVPLRAVIRKLANVPSGPVVQNLAANGDPTRDVNDPGSNNQSPHLTRDGNWLFFASDRGRPENDLRIYRVRWNPATNDVAQQGVDALGNPVFHAPQVITFSGPSGALSLPTTNTDGSLLFVTEIAGSEHRLWRVELASGQAVSLTDSGELEANPSWTP
ncbi:MAG: hypothetical protein AB7S38_08335 [Vulcanimicrobiota bacterium]